LVVQVAKELETLHAAAAEQLEGLYEARLALEGERLAQLAAAKDDMELSLKVSGDDDCRCCEITARLLRVLRMTAR
jgi:hypothetical protein